MKNIIYPIMFIVLLSTWPIQSFPQGIIINHNSTILQQIPETWINQAKTQFRVWYGHTSHGSQITSGIENIQSHFGAPYTFNISGSGGSLSYQELDWYDLGHNGDLYWEYLTREQLNSPENDRNLVMWSWCGGVSDNTEEGINIYLEAMNQLELDYPNVIFVYMTGHLDIWAWQNLKERNQQIRDYCMANNKILFDFADIESYNPDGTFFNYATDDCSYYTGPGWGYLGNWAQEWCASHPGSALCEDCYCAHSESLNCNLKGRAFWWMMAKLAGWDEDQKAFFVDKNNPAASNNNPGTIGLPWLSIQHAADVASPGDTIYIRNGIYAESVATQNDGNDEMGPIVFSAYPGENPVIDGTNVNANAGFYLQNSFIKLIGLEIRNWQDAGIWAEDASFFEIHDCEIHDMIFGVGISGNSHDFLLQNVEVHHFDLYGIDASPLGDAYCYNGNFINCLAHTGRDMEQNVDGFALGHGLQSNFFFDHCEAYDVYDGFDISSSSTMINGCRAHNCWNTCYKLWQDQVELVNSIGYHGEIAIVQLCWTGSQTETTLRNCTFYDSQVYTIWIANSNNIINLYNCIISGGENIGLSFEQNSTANYHGNFNLFQNNNPARAISVGYSTEFSLEEIGNGDWNSYAGQDANSEVVQIANEIFTAPSIFDLHLTSQNQAVDHGSATWAPDIDFEGTPRPFGYADDIGAYEFNSLNHENQHLILKQGWNGISAYLLPNSPDPDVVMAPIINALIILQNQDGIYWPGQNINTLGNWNPDMGYLIKLSQEADLIINGSIQDFPVVGLQAGWNLIPVLNSCGIDMDEIIYQLGAEMIFIKEAVGMKVFWPEMGIQTLNRLIPGNSYYIFLASNSSLTFPDCGK